MTWEGVPHVAGAVLAVTVPAVALAAACGLRAFLPALAIAIGARLGTVHPAGAMAWLGSDAALWTLALATVLELAADKVPVLDHALDVAGTVVRPAAAALLAMAWYGGVAPSLAVPAAIITGAGAFAVQLAKAKTRVGSTVLTFGHATPALSLGEDVAAAGFVAPVAAGFAWVPVLLLGAPVVALVVLALTFRRRRGTTG
jgi:hypothetical protein